MNSNMTASALSSRARRAAAIPSPPPADHSKPCPRCGRMLALEPDGSVFCVSCVRPSFWRNLVSLVEPSEGWKEIGWLLRGLAAALVFAVGVIGWAVAIGGTSVVTGWWGLKAATGAIYLGIGVQALVAIPTAVVVRGFAAGRTNRQVMHWCLAMLILPGLAAAVRLIHVGIVQVG